MPTGWPAPWGGGSADARRQRPTAGGAGHARRHLLEVRRPRQDRRPALTGGSGGLGAGGWRPRHRRLGECGQADRGNEAAGGPLGDHPLAASPLKCGGHGPAGAGDRIPLRRCRLRPTERAEPGSCRARAGAHGAIRLVDRELRGHESRIDSPRDRCQGRSSPVRGAKCSAANHPLASVSSIRKRALAIIHLVVSPEPSEPE